MVMCVRKGAVFSIELHVLYLPLITSHNIPQELDYSYLRNGQVCPFPQEFLCLAHFNHCKLMSFQSYFFVVIVVAEPPV